MKRNDLFALRSLCKKHLDDVEDFTKAEIALVLESLANLKFLDRLTKEDRRLFSIALCDTASALRNLIELPEYKDQVCKAVIGLLHSNCSLLRYVGLDFISAGRHIVPWADELFEEGKVILANEDKQYVRDYLAAIE